MATTAAGFATVGSSGGVSSGIASTKIAAAAASIIPQGVGAPPPPGLDPKKGKLMCIKVRMLDDTVGVFHLGHKAVGQALFEEVCRHLNLLECDYFGLEFLDCYGNSCWLDKEKTILKQISMARSDARFYFMVKFYTPNPADLEEDYTRYLLALQIKRDLSCGHFVCNENTAALMASYIVQSECGDFSSDDYYDHSYLSSVRFIPNQSAEFEKKVMDNHKKLIGMSPSESDLALLETARRAEFYGVKFHPCRDAEGTPVNLTVLHLGIKVYHQLTCASTFSWAKVRKLSFKRKKLFIKLHPESYAYYKDTIEFAFETRNECKMFWKKCIEHHTFFRCNEVTPLPRHQSKFFTKGSSFRYSGRTQKQLIDYVREHQKRREPFTRPIHSSMTRKVLSEEHLLPTPDSSQPGTLTRQNGNLSTPALRLIDMPEGENGQNLPSYATLMSDLDPDQNPVVRDENATVIDTPQSKRKGKGAVCQQFSFHVPLNHSGTPMLPVSGDDEVSGIWIGEKANGSPFRGHPSADPRGHPPNFANLSAAASVHLDQRASPRGGRLTPIEEPVSPGLEGDGADEDDLSDEDSYHLSEYEQRRRRQGCSYPLTNSRSYTSTNRPIVPATTISFPADFTNSGRVPLQVFEFGEHSKSSDFGFVSTNSHQSRSLPSVAVLQQQQRRIQHPSAAAEEGRAPTPIPSTPTSRGLPGPLPGKVLSKTPVITALPKPIPPPKPKMGVVRLEASAVTQSKDAFSLGPQQRLQNELAKIVNNLEMQRSADSGSGASITGGSSTRIGAETGATMGPVGGASSGAMSKLVGGAPVSSAIGHSTDPGSSLDFKAEELIKDELAVSSAIHFPAAVPVIAVQSEESPDDQPGQVVHLNGSPGRPATVNVASPKSPHQLHGGSEIIVKETNSNNAYSISSPFRKGARLQSIESSSSGQLTLAGSLQQLPPPSTPTTTKSMISSVATTGQTTPPKKQNVKSPVGTPSPTTNGRHNYENVETYAYSAVSFSDGGTGTTGTMASSTSGGSVERTIPIRLAFSNDSADRSFSSSLQHPSNEHRIARRHASSSKAFCITKELLMTERTYLHDLSIISKHFKAILSPLLDALPANQADQQPQQSMTPQTRHKPMGVMSLQKHQENQDALLVNNILSIFEPLHDFHENLLQEVEKRHQVWENKLTNQQHSPSTPSASDTPVQKIGDILLCGIHNSLQTYQHYFSQALLYLTSLNDIYRNNRKFAGIYKEFEAQKLCYVPINVLLLKPLRRLFTYEAILTRLIAHYIEEGGINPDLSDCKVAQEKLSSLTSGQHGKAAMRQLENFVKLVQVERDLIDVQNLVLPTRTFIREGSLQRFSKKEPVQRLFLLFNDCLLYAGRSGGSASSQQMTFRLHGQIPLRGLMLENGDALRMCTQGAEKYAFTIYGGNRSFVVAAASAEEKQLWLEDINRTVMEAKESKADFPHFPSMKSASSVDDVGGTNVSNTSSTTVAVGGVSTFKPSSLIRAKVVDVDDSASTGALTAQSPNLSSERHWYYRANDTLHVCWHRNTTLGTDQWHLSAAKCQMSGYLLRKFRTSSGWQKLWVVFCDFCLFFHKNHQDGLPLASLPLLGYIITLPDAKDEIHKDFVFKLQYKTQYYFFRADSDYAYNRWLEVLRIACHDRLNQQ